MKLNKKGWGYLMMFALLFILITALIFAWYYAYETYKKIDEFENGPSETDLGNPTDNRRQNYYYGLEVKLDEAGKKYIELMNYSCKDHPCIINYKSIKKMDYISVLLDYDTANECDGYIKIKHTNIEAYIKCDNYVTEGY